MKTPALRAILAAVLAAFAANSHAALTAIW